LIDISRRGLPGRSLEGDLFALCFHERPDLGRGLRVDEEVLVVEAVFYDKLLVLRPGGVEGEDELLGRGVAERKRVEVLR